MATIFNPWADPVETGTLSGEFATPELNGEMQSEDSEMEMEMEGDSMSQALGVIQQQSTLIAQLLDKLKTS